jgi:hypothetical protein
VSEQERTNESRNSVLCCLQSAIENLKSKISLFP